MYQFSTLFLAASLFVSLFCTFCFCPILVLAEFQSAPWTDMQHRRRQKDVERQCRISSSGYGEVGRLIEIRSAS